MAHAARPDSGCRRSPSWTTPFVWKNDERTEIVTTGHGVMVMSYGLDGKELWRITGMSMPTASPFAVEACSTSAQRLAGRRQASVLRDQAGRHPATSRWPTATPATTFIAWSHPRASGYTPSALVHDGTRLSRARHRHPGCSRCRTGEQIYKVRVGGGGHTFSASPIAAGNRIYLLTEDGVTFVLDSGTSTRKSPKTIWARCRWRRRRSPAARSISGRRRSYTRSSSVVGRQSAVGSRQSAVDR